MSLEYKNRLNFEGARAFVNGMGFVFVTGFEMIRASLVHPKLNIPSVFEQKRELTPYLSPDSSLFPLLQNSGNFFDGYMINMVGFNGLTALDLLQARFTNRYVPQRLKASISTLVTIGGVYAFEAGMLHQGGTNDLSDVPAGVIGALAFLGADSISRKLAKVLLA